MDGLKTIEQIENCGRGKTILVVGDVMLDRYWHGDTSRVSPEAPVPVVLAKNEEDRVGGAGNVAANIAQYGARVRVFGCVGDDEQGKKVKACLEQLGCLPHLEVIPEYQTVTKLRVLSRHQQLLRIDFESAPKAEVHKAVIGAAINGLDGVDLIVVSDYAKGAVAEPQDLILEAKRRGIPVLVDPKRSNFSAYAGALVVTPNMHEFSAACGPCDEEDEIASKASHLMEQAGIKNLLITRSEQGMTLVEGRERVTHMPAQARDVFDVTGAGDTVLATLAVAIACGAELRDASRLANIAAGLAVGKMGTASVSLDEMRLAVSARANSSGGYTNKVVAPDLLKQLCREAKANGQSIVFTNGCFDLLHKGHVTYLEQAKALGDRLIVALNDDPSVRRLKGGTRPINDLGARMAVIAGLSSVDWVTHFSEDTPEQLIHSLTPDILVKGGDYRPEEIAGADFVIKKGGRVEVMSFVDGHSTSAIIDRAGFGEKE